MATTTTVPPLRETPCPPDDPALSAYEEMAVVYDAFTSAHDYERFLSAVERFAQEHGLTGTDVLDVACGTGEGFVPLLERGYRVTACDLSPEMVRLAQDRSAGIARVLVADMRELPDLGHFDLVTCLDDSMNYLLTEDDLASSLAGISRLLRPGGVLVFDVNTLSTYRSTFSQTFANDQEGIFFCWRGDTSPELEPGGRAAATLEAFVPGAAGTFSRRCSRHMQRHHPRETVTRLCAASGLDVTAVLGMSAGVRLDSSAQEAQHMKFLYLARRAKRST